MSAGRHAMPYSRGAEGRASRPGYEGRHVRPSEPMTVGSVVTAACVHSEQRTRWIRGFDGNWWAENRVTYNAPGGDRSMPDDWDSLLDPHLMLDALGSET